MKLDTNLGPGRPRSSCNSNSVRNSNRSSNSNSTSNFKDINEYEVVSII